MVGWLVVGYNLPELGSWATVFTIIINDTGGVGNVATTRVGPVSYQYQLRRRRPSKCGMGRNKSVMMDLHSSLRQLSQCPRQTVHFVGDLSTINFRKPSGVGLGCVADNVFNVFLFCTCPIRTTM